MTTPVERLSAALLGHYEIEREIGQGGMATVYLAHDVRHQRKVALKILRPELSAILGGERFLHEIRTTANLQHPHILPLHDSGEADGIVYYVMPYVQGESLRARLTREKQLPVEDAVRLAREVAEALDYAHRQGVVHRDIKPENILLHEERAQVADFGIALAVSSAGGGTRMTETGMSLGTPHYMSPEQAMGEREISAKSDIYALGCVLYEMLVGEPPFTGPSAQAIIARVVTEEPRSLVVQRRTIPPHLEAAVRKALQKMPADRFANAAQFAAALANPEMVALPAARAGDAVAAAARTSGASSRLRSLRLSTIVLATLLALTAAAAAFGWRRETPFVPDPVTRFMIPLPAGARFLDAPGAGMAMSPDGSRFVYVGTDERGQRWLYLRNLAQLEPVPIPGTRGGSQPFFSPDGLWLGFLAAGKVQKVALSGGPPLTVSAVDSGFFGATWGTGDVIVFGSDVGLRQVPAAGGQPALLTQLDTTVDFSHGLPHFLPDGKTVLFQTRGNDLANLRLAVVTLATRAVKRFTQAGGNPRYVNSGHVVLTNVDGTITSVPFDVGRLEVAGPPIPVAEGVAVAGNGAAEMGTALGGSAVYATGSGGVRTVMLVDRSGAAQPLSTELRSYGGPRVSPDGRRIALDVADGGSSAVWILDVAQKTLTRMTFDPNAVRPSWTPDGSRVAYTRGVEAPDMAWIRADGSALAESLLVARGRQFGDTWAPDGRTFVYHENNLAVTRNDIMLLSADSTRSVRPYLKTPADEFAPAVSPDGRWLAYSSDESGRIEVYVRSFPNPGAKIQVSLDGGTEPRWSANGRELFYRNGDKMLAAAVQLSAEFTVQRRVDLFRGNFAAFQFHAQYDVTRDGKFVMLQGPQASSDLIVVLNWFDQLRGRRNAQAVGSAAGQ
ncbi:MAG: protein kinase [Gemmatimonadaceae bacterium]